MAFNLFLKPSVPAAQLVYGPQIDRQPYSSKNCICLAYFSRHTEKIPKLSEIEMYVQKILICVCQIQPEVFWFLISQLYSYWMR